MSVQNITLQCMHGMHTNQIECTVSILSSTWQLLQHMGGLSLTHCESRATFSCRLVITIEAIEPWGMSWKGWAQLDICDMHAKVDNNPANESRTWLAGTRINAAAWRRCKAKKL